MQLPMFFRQCDGVEELKPLLDAALRIRDACGLDGVRYYPHGVKVAGITVPETRMFIRHGDNPLLLLVEVGTCGK